MTDAPDKAVEISDEDLETTTGGALLLPAVQAAGDETLVAKPKLKVWPWHFW